MVLALVPSPAHAAQLSQAYIAALTEDSMAGAVTQGAVRALVRQVPCLTRWAQCWRIERRDGVVFTFTSHDQRLLFRGEWYEPCHSLAASAAELGVALGQPGTLELAGIIADEAISETDLYAGLFDRATVEIWMVPWENQTGEVPFRLTAGIAGNLSQGDDGFALEVQTAAARLQQQPLLDTYTPSCRWELGDERCSVDLDALMVTGSVTSVAALRVHNASARRFFTDSSRSEADGYFDQGTVLWTSGANAGQRVEIKSFTGGQFVLWQPVIYTIEIGDEYEARPGCNKTPDACKNKFDNYVNYGGFPDVPGRDGIMQTPYSEKGPNPESD